MVDFFLLLMLGGAGDELQGIKRGIMEMADSIIINKADGDNVKNSTRAQAEYKSALHLFPPTDSGWIPEVITASALQGDGVENAWEIIDRFVLHTTTSGYFNEKRAQQALFWLKESIEQDLTNDFYAHPEIKTLLPTLKDQILEGSLHTYSAAKELLKAYKNKG